MLAAVRRILAESRPHAGLELVFTPKEEVGLLGAAEVDTTALAARVGFVYDHAGPIGEVVSGAPSASSDRRGLPRPRGPRRHAPGGGTVRDLRRRSRDRRPPARPRRRRDDRERRWDPGRECAQHRPGPLRGDRRGAIARRAEAPRARAGDGRLVRVRGRPDRVRGRRHGRGLVPGLRLRPDDAPLRLAFDALARPASILAASAPAVARMRTSSTSGDFRAPTSPTGWPGSTARTSTSRSPTSRPWSRSR